MTEFSSPGSRRLYALLSQASDGFENTEVLEAGSVLVAQSIASGCLDLDGVEAVVRQMARAMLFDIQSNWPRTLEQRKAKRQ